MTFDKWRDVDAERAYIGLKIGWGRAELYWFKRLYRARWGKQ